MERNSVICGDAVEVLAGMLVTNKIIRKWLKKWLVEKKDIDSLLKKFANEYKGDITFVPEVLVPYVEKKALTLSRLKAGDSQTTPANAGVSV